MLDDFLSLPIEFDTETYTVVFGRKNNKTLEETFAHQRYAKLGEQLARRYVDDLNTPLGEFLLKLKEAGDRSYRLFLNKYGDLTYCRFRLSSVSDGKRKGVYCFFVDGQIKYVGRCRDAMKKRIDNGYGRIHPKNCFLDSQSTNCHLNAQIAAVKERTSLRLREVNDDAAIVLIERDLIAEFSPEWNIQRSR